MIEMAQSWVRAKRWASVVLLVVIALFLFCFFYFGSRV